MEATPVGTGLSKLDLWEMPGRPLAWHALGAEQVYRKLQTTGHGLDTAQVTERQREFGKNILPARKPPTVLQVLIHQFASPLIYVLLAAGLVSAAVGDLKDAGFIFVVVLLNAAIGTYQEYRAEQSAHALQNLLKVEARVRRSGRSDRIPAEDVVPGDVVLLESGDRVPADLRLVEIRNLQIDESFLTGESIAAEKAEAVVGSDTTLADRANMAYAGSTVVSGRGVGLVVATGAHTEVGRIASAITVDTGTKPPLVMRMERFSRQITFVVLAFAAVLGAVSVARGMPVGYVFFLMVALAVSAIPEGLPVAMTVALSLATKRMARRNVIVRRLMAVESLGSCTVIATDKTGTLTVNQQTARRVVLPDGVTLQVTGQGYSGEGEVLAEGSEPPDDALRRRLVDVAMASVLCNEASLVRAEGGTWRHTGDAMDVALLALAAKLSLDPERVRAESPILAQIPFESERRYAATAVRAGETVIVCAKGALEALLPFCQWMRTAGGDVDIDREALSAQALRLAEDGYRVLAVAVGPLPSAPDPGQELQLPPLVLLGLVGFIDPLRPEVKDAVSVARRAGLRVVMITGDHPATALAIARELGIAGTAAEVVTGQDLAGIGSYEVPEFYERVRQATVFARVTPHEKLHIVDALMKLGEFVAVTGDGVNDAPALRRANIGVAMGSGTDIARDTASMIVTDDNFASIVAGIEEGRYAYANVRKVTLLLISTGAAELMLLGVAILAGLPLPLVAVQILWLNLVTNGIQDVALAFEAGEKGVMDLPPRSPTEGIFNRSMIEQVAVAGLTMALVCLGAWVVLINGGWRPGWGEDAARSALLTLLVLMQFYHVQNCRSERVSAFRVPFSHNWILMIGVACAFVLHVLATEVPILQALLRTKPLPLVDWLALAAVASAILIVMEIYKHAVAQRRVRSHSLEKR